jgi:probable phosphoglycerate mutase
VATILLIRHGETDWNREKRLQGFIDIGLNAIGIEQAKLLASVLQSESIDAAYASDLVRAYDTAHTIAQHHQLEVLKDPSLRERCYGEIQGKTYAEIAVTHPENYEAWVTRNAHFQPQDGESLQQFYDRVINGLKNIAKQHLGQTILVVAHGGVLDCVYRAAENIPLSEKRKIELLNTSLNRLKFDGEKFQIISWGDTSHLAGDALDEVDRQSFPKSVSWDLP